MTKHERDVQDQGFERVSLQCFALAGAVFPSPRRGLRICKDLGPGCVREDVTRTLEPESFNLGTADLAFRRETTTTKQAVPLALFLGI